MYFISAAWNYAWGVKQEQPAPPQAMTPQDHINRLLSWIIESEAEQNKALWLGEVLLDISAVCLSPIGAGLGAFGAYLSPPEVVDKINKLVEERAGVIWKSMSNKSKGLFIAAALGIAWSGYGMSFVGLQLFYGSIALNFGARLFLNLVTHENAAAENTKEKKKDL